MTKRHGESPRTLRKWARERSAFLSGAIVTLAVAIMLTSSLRNPADFDSWWHLQMGKDLIEQGLSPYKDHYSYTYEGERISTPPVPFQVGFYVLNRWLGERGGQVAYKALAFVLLIGLFAWWLARLDSPLSIRFLVLASLLPALQQRVMVRPELLGYSLLLISVVLYARARERLDTSSMWPILFLMLCWVNYHGAILGYVVFAGLFVDIAFRLISEKAKTRDWFAWLVWGLLLLLIGFMNPQGFHPIFEQLSFAPEWKTLINEYRVPSDQLTRLTTYIWLPIALLTLLMALIQKRWGYVLTLSVFLYSAITMVRMLTPALILFLAVFAELSSNRETLRWFKSLQRSFQNVVLTVSVLAAATMLIYSVLLARGFLWENVKKVGVYPEAALDYMAEKGISGNIFNSYGIGGLILHRLSPSVRVYIDGRTNILYPLEHMLRYESARRETSAFEEEVQKYGINYALLVRSAGTDRLMASAGFSLEFADAYYGLYKKGEARFALIGELSRSSYCIDIIEEPGFIEEVAESLTVLPEYSYVRSLAALGYNYLHAQDRRAYLASINRQRLVTDQSRRLYAAMTLRHELHDAGLAALNELVKTEPRDLMASQIHHIGAGRIREGAESLSRHLKSLSEWRDVYDRDLALLLWVLRAYEAEGLEPLLEQDAMDELNSAVTSNQRILESALPVDEVLCDTSPSF